MIRTIVFALALTFGVGASPVSNHTKEISPMIDIVYAAEAAPCPPIIVTVTQKEAVPTPKAKPISKAKVKVKKKKRPQFKTDKQKKKHVAHTTKVKDKKTDHHKSKVPHHHKSIPSNNSTSHGPLHLTSPPGCG